MADTIINKEGSDYLKSFLDSMPMSMVMTDGNGRIRYANAAFRSRYHLDEDVAEGDLLCEVIACDIFFKPGGICTQNCGQCKMYEMEREVMSTGRRIVRKMFTYQRLIEGKPHKRSFRISAVPMDYCGSKAVILSSDDVTFERNAINELTDTIMNLRESRDNTEQENKENRDLATYLKWINESLQKEKNKLRLLFDNMTTGFMLAHYKDGELYFQEGNNKLGELLKTNMTSFCGRRLIPESEYYTPEFFNHMLAVIETGRAQEFTTTVPNKDIALDLRINMYMPEPDYVAIIVTDISEETKAHRANMEQARQLRKLNVILDDRNSELQKAVETKNKFISLIAHDLRNPLNAINGLSDLLTKRLKPETDQRALDMAKVLHQSAKGASELLDNLLIWARTQQNTIQFNPDTHNLHAVTAETLSEIKVQADRKHIMLINQTGADDTVWADKLMLQTIIRNITSNAIKFTNEGGLIVIGSNQTAETTEIRIEDNGVGMTEETIQRILQTTELNSTKGTSGESGTGMGLIISKEFIQRHKGTLNIESTVGKGSTFIITLPCDSKKNDEKK